MSGIFSELMPLKKGKNVVKVKAKKRQGASGDKNFSNEKKIDFF
jgi:hypothetical protein